MGEKHSGSRVNCHLCFTVCVPVSVCVCACVCVCVTTSTASDWNVFGFSVLTVTRAQDHHIFLLVITVPIMPVSVLLHRVANDGVWVTPVSCCGPRFTHRVPLWVITLVLRTRFLSSVSLRRVLSLIQYVTITFIHNFWLNFYLAVETARVHSVTRRWWPVTTT